MIQAKKNATFYIVTGIEAMLMTLVALMALFPFVYMLFISLTQARSLTLNLSFSSLGLINYDRVFRNFDFFTSLKNSVVVSFCACALN